MRLTSTLTLAAALYVGTSFAQDGHLDTTFNHDGLVYHEQVLQLNRHPRVVQRILVMPDSSMVLGCQSDVDPSDPLGYYGYELCRLDRHGNPIDTLPGQPSWMAKSYRYIDPHNTGINVAADGNGVRDLQLLPDGKLLLTGSVLTANGYQAQTTFRVNYPSLTLDSSYGLNGMGQVWEGAYSQIAMRGAIAADGSSFVVGNGYYQYAQYDTSHCFITKRRPDGMLDSSWQTNGVYVYTLEAGCSMYDIRLAPDGSIFLAGGYKDAGTVSHALIVKLKPDGTIDPSFGTGGWVENEYSCYSMALDAVGNVYMNGLPYMDNSYVARYTASGLPDSTFGINGRCDVPSHPPGNFTLYGSNDMLLQADGKILMIGNGQGIYDSCWLATWRITANGYMDSTFANNGIANLHIMPDSTVPGLPSPILRSALCGALQADGRLLMGGYFEMGQASYGEMTVTRLANTVGPTAIAHGPALLPLQLQAWPIPATGMLYFRYTLQNSDAVQAVVIDASGRTVMQQAYTRQAGSSQEGAFNVSRLPRGSYWLQLQGATHYEAIPVMLQ